MRVLALLLLLAGAGMARVTAAPASTTTPPEAPLPLHAAVVLGFVEGVTEFLPISSTGHLIIVAELLGLEDATPLHGPQGEILWRHPPGPQHPDGVILTRKHAIDAYVVVIQGGAILAVLLLCGGEVRSMLRGLAGRSERGLRLLRNVIFAVAPVVVAGLLLGPWIEAHLFSPGTVITALVLGAFVMIGAERWRRSHPADALRTGADLSAREALGIGLAQCLALWPGMSRAMVTIVGGYACRLPPARAAEFSFLVGLPVLAGAALYKGVRTGPAMIAGLGWTPVLVGGLVAALSAALAVRFLVHHLSRHGLTAFALYRLGLAVILLTWGLT